MVLFSSLGLVVAAIRVAPGVSPGGRCEAPQDVCRRTFLQCFVAGETAALPAHLIQFTIHSKQRVRVQQQPAAKKHEVIVKTIVASVVVVATNVVGNYALSRGMHEVGIVESLSPMPYIRAFVHPWVAIGVVFMMAWVASRLALLSWADLSYVVPVTSFSYVLSALAAEAWLGEHVKPLRWAGIAVITLGVALVALTYPETPELYHEAPVEDEVEVEE